MGARSIIALLAALLLASSGSALEPPTSVRAVSCAQDDPNAGAEASAAPRAWLEAGWGELWPGPPAAPLSWRRVRSGLTAAPAADASNRRSAAAYVVRYLERDEQAATDAGAALDVLFDAPPGVGYLRDVARVAGAKAVGRALFVARADSERVDRWARSVAAAVEDESDAAEPFAVASIARLLAARLDAARGEFALAIDTLFEAARAGDRLAPAARGAAFELLRDTVAARTRRWLDAWATRDEAVAEAPERAAWPRMLELAELGEARATWWCWMCIDALDGSDVARSERRSELARRLVEEPESAEFARSVARDAMACAKPATRASLLEILAELGGRAQDDEDRAWCLWARAHLLAKVEPLELDDAVALLRRLVRELPASDLARSAGPWIYALENLRLGSVLPDFDRPDARGRTVDLAARRGRVVVLAFWEDSPRGRSLLSVLDQLGLLYSRERFDVVLVNVDDDVDAARERYAASGREWEVSWQGSRNSAWPVTWNVKTFPSVFIVDAQGVVRARDMFGAELTSKVLELLGN